MSRPVFTDYDFQGAGRVRNLLDPVLAQDAATKAYVDVNIEGLSWKDNVKVATQSNINLTAPGASIDGVAMSIGDRFLARVQTATADNGIYIWNGAASAATRSADANTGVEVLNATVGVDQGTSAGVTFRQTAVSVTIGTTSLTFATFGTAVGQASTSSQGTVQLATQAEVDTGTDTAKAVTPATLQAKAGFVKKFTASLGDGSATQYLLNHNLNTRDVQCAIIRSTSPWDEVIADLDYPTVNQVRVTFSIAPAANAFRAVVVG